MGLLLRIKITVFTLFFCLFLKNGNAQYAIAGVIGSKYYDVVPDTLLSNCSGTGTESYDIDINLDNISDIRIATNCAGSLGPQLRVTDVLSLNSSTKLLFDHRDSTYVFWTNSWNKRDLLKGFLLGDTIFPGKPVSFGYLSYYYLEPTATSNSPWFFGSSYRYFGVQYQNSLGTYYGWVRVSLGYYSTCLVYESSLNQPACNLLNLNSTIGCAVDSSKINFNISAGSTPPFTFTVIPPASCSGSFVTSVSSFSPSFTFSCQGVYTFSVKDSLNYNLGVFTHTISVDTLFVPTSISATNDTICSGASTSLNIITTTPSYTISLINWSNGSVGSPITVSPTVTSTYSVSGLYVSASSKSCTAIGSKTIVVNSCVGVFELDKIENIVIYPNPATEKLHILNLQNKFQSSEIEITNYLCQTVLIQPFKNEIDVSKLAQGIYTLKITAKNNQSFYSKFIKE